MEVDPAVGRSPSGDLDSVSRPTYAQVVAGTQAIGQQPALSHGLTGIEAVFGDEALSSGRPLDWSTEGADVPLFVQPSSMPIKLVWSG